MKSKYILLFFSVVLTCFCACKKDAAKRQISIIGKWHTTSLHATAYFNGAQIYSLAKTAFTTDDFVQYFSDGTGILSASTDHSPSLSSFTYKINGSTLTQLDSGGGAAIAETITKLTTDSLSIHYAILVIDSNTGLLDNEIDDYTFKR
jgi:hypothetical protein